MKKRILAFLLCFAMVMPILPVNAVTTDTTDPTVTTETTTVTDPTDYSEPATEPSEPATEPSEPATEPSEPATEPSEPETEPSEVETEPSEAETEPSEAETEPSEPENEPSEPENEPSEPTEEGKGLTGELLDLYNAILACQNQAAYEALMASTDPTKVNAMSAAMNEAELNVLLEHMAKINQPEIIPVDVNVTIQNTILTNGSLTANITNPQNGVTYTYQWYKSENGNDNSWVKIENTPTVTGTAQTMYVARDGARMYYYVEVFADGTLVGTSASYLVQYDDSLQNGSFEDPVNQRTNAGPQYPENDVPYWYTTGKGTSTHADQDIEILSVAKNDSRNNFNLTESNNAQDRNRITSWIETEGGTRYTVTGVPDGSQCAELNCEAWGALYQDVLTEPGSTLYWAFYHRGRFGSNNDQMDQMQLIIINAAGIDANWNPAGAYNSEGVQVTSEANKNAWVYHSGEYIVPAGQYVTRFYFVSTQSFNGTSQSQGTNATVGNFLDYIWFDDDLPEPPATYSNLTISKTVDATYKDFIPAESFTFSVTNGTETKTVKLPTTNGEWSASLVGVTPGEWSITETNYNVDGFTYGSTTNSGGTDSNGTSCKINMAGGNAYTVSFNNNYTENNVTINYVALDGGTVSTSSEPLPKFTGDANGSTATANAGYEFVGWYDNADCEGTALTTNAAFDPTKPDTGWVDGTTYYAKFEEKVASITYKVVGPDGTVQTDTTIGSVDLNDNDTSKVAQTSESVNMVTGTALGATAEASSNVYKFVGWYSDEECKLEVSTSANYVPTKPDTGWVDGTIYYAKFEYNLTDLTISKTVSNGTYDEQDTFIFEVCHDSEKITTVTLKAGQSITITGVTVGDSYTIKEIGGGSNRYTASDDTITKTIAVEKANNNFDFTNTLTKDKWLSASDVKHNVFG